MIIDIKVIPGAKKNLVVEEGGRIVKVYLTSPPVEGRANEALIEFLAEHFGLRKSQIEIIKGLKSRNKVIKISGVSA
ncbi:MAG: YggU family protein [Candidatus Omnitrophica bacterium]|nr:YggU family protein [Candidatus Omnitrophota bacterium]